MRDLSLTGRKPAWFAGALVLCSAAFQAAGQTPAPVPQDVIDAVYGAQAASQPSSSAPTTPASKIATASAASEPISPWSAAVKAPTSASTEDILAADSLTRSARSLIFNRSPQLATRLIALTGMAQRLGGSDPDMLLLLADIYQSQAKDSLTAQTLEKLLTIFPNSHSLSQRWLFFAMKSQDSASQRLALLQAVIDDKNAPDPIRAEAAYRKASILQGQGQKDEGLSAIYQALQLDPWHSAALEERFRSISKPKAADRANLLLGQLHGDPRNWTAGWEMGVLVGRSGMYEQAVGFMSYTMMLMQLKGIEDTQKVQNIQALYYNAVLDLLQSTKDADGLKKLAAMVANASKTFPQNTDLQALQIEAYQQAGMTAEADKAIAAMKSYYDDRLKKTPMLTSDFAAELAWFYISTVPDPDLAMKYAKTAAEIKEMDPAVKRIMGIAKLMSPDDQTRLDGEKLLKEERVITTEPFAGVFLAEYYDRRGDVENRNYAIDVASSISRSGPAWRRVINLMRKVEERDKKEVKLTELKNAAEVKTAFEAMDTRYLEVLSNPDKFLSVKIRAVREKVLPGEPMELEATLSNVGPVPLPMGETGLFSPVMIVVVKAGPNPNQTFYNLPMFTWQAPRYLAAGQTLTSRVRLDMGPLGEYLDARPLEEIPLEIHSLVDAELRGQTYVSAIPALKIAPVTLTRLNLLSMADQFENKSSSSWSPAYKQVLGTIAQKSILRGELPDRMLAARQVGCLQSAARNSELNSVKIPQLLAQDFDKKVILAMLAALLKDKSPAVRAEAVAAIPEVAPDQETINLLYPMIDDASPAVRLRVLNKLCTMEFKGQSRLIEKFLKDSDESIRNLATMLAGTK